MASTLLDTKGDYRLVRYETPYPPIYEVWRRDDRIFYTYWRSSARRRLRREVQTETDALALRIITDEARHMMEYNDPREAIYGRRHDDG